MDGQSLQWTGSAGLHAVRLIAEAIFRLGRGDLDCLSRHVLGLNGDRGIKRWWLRFDVIEDLFDYVWVSDVGDNPPGAATQGA